jgi:NAD(P)-dependent dehydrogenase (short-subunit alcohol dehydrogenase family)
VELLVADLRVLEEVRRLAAEFQQTHHHLHLLVNNAGAAYPTRTLTPDGFETTLAVNYLAPQTPSQCRQAALAQTSCIG